MGNIDLDPASSEFANTYVGADKFFTAKDDPINEAQWFGKGLLLSIHRLVLYYNKREARWIPTRGSLSYLDIRLCHLVENFKATVAEREC